MALSDFSIPALSVPLLPIPNPSPNPNPNPNPNPIPIPITPTVPIPTNPSTSLPPITISFPPPPTIVPTIFPTTDGTPTVRPTTPTVPVPTPSTTIPRPTITPIPPLSIESSSSRSRLSRTQSTYSSSAEPPTSPESSPPLNVSNIGANTSTSAATTQGAPPPGQLSPNQPSMPFLQNKGAKAGVFSVVGVVALAMIAGIAAFVYHRRKRKQTDLEHIEAMIGYQNRGPLDGEDDAEPSSHGHTATSHSYYPSQKTSEETAPPSTTYFMQERAHDDLPVYLPSHMSARPPEEYDPYRDSPFADYHASTSNNRYGSQPLDPGADYDYNVGNGSDESHLDPPRRWPQLGKLPPAFGSPPSETSMEIPRPALRVTNGLDDTRA